MDTVNIALSDPTQIKNHIVKIWTYHEAGALTENLEIAITISTNILTRYIEKWYNYTSLRKVTGRK